MPPGEAGPLLAASGPVPTPPLTAGPVWLSRREMPINCREVSRETLNSEHFSTVDKRFSAACTPLPAGGWERWGT